MSYKKLSHVVWDCKYHVVIVPKKYRYNVFSREVKEAVKDEFKKLCTWLRIEIIEGHVCKAHIHMCLVIPPEYAVSEVIGILKGKIAIRMFKKCPDLRKKYWGSHFWNRGYANIISKNEEMIREYIKN